MSSRDRHTNDLSSGPRCSPARRLGPVVLEAFDVGPGLLLQGTFAENIVGIATAFIGTFAIAVAIVGCFARPLPSFQRLLFLIAGALLIFQGIWSGIAGLLLLAALWFLSQKPHQTTQTQT